MPFFGGIKYHFVQYVRSGSTLDLFQCIKSIKIMFRNIRHKNILRHPSYVEFDFKNFQKWNVPNLEHVLLHCPFYLRNLTASKWDLSRDVMVMWCSLEMVSSCERCLTHENRRMYSNNWTKFDSCLKTFSRPEYHYARSYPFTAVYHGHTRGYTYIPVMRL